MMRLFSIVMLTGCLILQAGDLVGGKKEYDSLDCDETAKRSYLRSGFDENCEILKKILKKIVKLTYKIQYEDEKYSSALQNMKEKKYYSLAVLCEINTLPLTPNNSPIGRWVSTFEGACLRFIEDIKKRHGTDDHKKNIEWAVNYIVKRQFIPASGMDEDHLERIKVFLAEHCKIN